MYYITSPLWRGPKIPKICTRDLWMDLSQLNLIQLNSSRQARVKFLFGSIQYDFFFHMIILQTFTLFNPLPLEFEKLGVVLRGLHSPLFIKSRPYSNPNFNTLP